MTRFHFDNQKKKSQVSRTRILVASGLTLIIIGVVVFVGAPLLRTLTSGPAWLARSAEITLENSVSMATPKKMLINENAALKAQIETYQAAQLELQRLQEENDQLRKELSYLPTPSATQTAQVIGKPNRSLFNTLVINMGSDQGIHVGQLVTVQHTLGIGTIASVSGRTATVELFGNPRFAGDVLLTTKGITVPAVGKGSGNFEIHIPREVAVADGDLLAFPQNPGIVIGVVKSIIFDARDPFQTVLARAPVNVQELRFVQVVK